MISNYLKWMPSKQYLKLKYFIRFKKRLDLKNPKTFNEKMQWLKLYDHKDIYTKMVDKYEAKKIIADTVGKKYIIPTLGVYDHFKDIDFTKLPKQFVIKCTHDSGGLVIVKNKNSFDKRSAEKKINKSLKNNYYYHSREWPYKNVKPRIIIEELMVNKNGDELVEYNFFCFNGVPKLVMTCHGDKRIKRYNNFYDINFNKLYFSCGYDYTDEIEKKPKQYEKMLEISGKISKDIPMLRVDFYLVDGKIKLGELTFFHWGGICDFDPKEWDRKLGDMLDLESVKKRKYR